jgi:predicted RNase H-like HicB family nuclease
MMKIMKNNIVFEILKEEEGGYSAGAVDYFIVTQGDTLDELMKNIEEATMLYFETVENPIKSTLPAITLQFGAHA